jgi:hypothetical protein
MIVSGKLTMKMASVLVIDEKKMINPQMTRFFEGILTACDLGIVK